MKCLQSLSILLFFHISFAQQAIVPNPDSFLLNKKEVTAVKIKKTVKMSFKYLRALSVTLSPFILATIKGMMYDDIQVLLSKWLHEYYPELGNTTAGNSFRYDK